MRKLNGCLRKGKYSDDLFKECCDGHSVKKLWKQYGEHLKDEKPGKEESSKDSESGAKPEIKSCS